MNLFESTPVKWWSGEKAVTCNGTAVARLRFGNWKTIGVITMDGNDYDVVGDSIFGGALSLRSMGVELCQTRIRGFWNRSAEFSLDGVAYTLKWLGWSSRAVLEKDGQEIGAVEPGELFSFGVRASFPESLPTLVAVFVLWLIAYKRKRDSSAAAG